MKYLNKYTAVTMIGVIVGMFLYIQFDKPTNREALIHTAKAEYTTLMQEFMYIQSVYQEKEAELMKYEEKLESIKNELEALSRVLSELNDAIDEEHTETLNTPKEVPNLTSEKTDIERWQVVHDLQKPLTKYWEGTVLEDKVDDLLLWCKASSVPRICVKVIAKKTQYETGKGTTGRALSQTNLTGTTCVSSGTETFNGIKYSYKCERGFRTYEQYYYALLDSVNFFVTKNYEDYFTLYGWKDGLARFLKRWGGYIHYGEMLHEMNNNIW